VSGWTATRRIVKYLRPYWWPHFVGALVCMVAYSATNGVIPYVVKELVDNLLQTDNAARLAQVPLLIVTVFLLRGLVNYGQAYLGEFVGQHITFDLRRDLEEHMLGLPLPYFDKAQTGNLLARMTTDVLLVRQALTEGAAAIIRDSTTVVVLLGVAF